MSIRNALLIICVHHAKPRVDVKDYLHFLITVKLDERLPADIISMNSYRSHQQNLDRILNMLEKGRFISRRQAASLFDCTEGTITIWLNELREDGHEIHYSRSLQKYVLSNKGT